MTTQQPYVKVGLFETMQFVADREAVGMPVPTPDQLKRAQRALDSNPAMHSQRTAIGLVLTALRLPLSKYERRALELKPVKTRNDHLVVEASPKGVEAFVEANPHMTAEDAAESIAGMSGYVDAVPALNRVSRYVRQACDIRRPCRHIREKMVMLSAIAQAATLIQGRSTAEQVA